VEYVIWERLTKGEKNPLIKTYLNLLAKRMKRFELENMNKADILLPVSQTDLDLFVQHGCAVPSKAIPTGYIFNTLPVIDPKEESAVAFIGGMDWIPNREGVDWFIAHVWPRILDKLPNAKFYLAGRNFPEAIKKLQVQGLKIVGEVENAHDFIFSKSISIVPLFAGSGMRVKIIEAMALGRVVVSTSVGAESIGYTDGKDILIEDNAENFASSIVKLLVDKELRMEIGRNAQQLILDKYDNRKICTDIINFCKPYLN
jgi:glycosyltransferase involved in cell wall biosynthesis